MGMEPIPLEKLRQEPERFSSSFPPDHAPLLRSMERVGLIRPLLVLEKGADFLVVLGHRRLRAARSLGMDTVPCRVLRDPVGKNEGALFRMNLEDNLAARPFNLVERACAAARVLDDPSLDSGARARYTALLEVPEAVWSRRRFLALARLEEEVKRFIVQRSLSERTAFLFVDLAPEDRVQVKQAAERFRLTASQVREVVVFTTEIAAREGVTFSRILEDTARDPAGPKTEEGGAARARFLQRLRARRMPDLTRTLARVETVLSRINGTPGVRVSPPSFLEGDTFCARIDFRNPAALSAGARALERFSRDPALAALFQEMEGSSDRVDAGEKPKEP